MPYHKYMKRSNHAMLLCKSGTDHIQIHLYPPWNQRLAWTIDRPRTLQPSSFMGKLAVSLV